MKATGMIRRIDDLGRIVIPKEIRRRMRIKEGEPLEIFIENNETICFKRYSYYEDVDFKKAKKLIMALYPNLEFALYDNLGELRAKNSVKAPLYFENKDSVIKNGEFDDVAYILFFDNPEMSLNDIEKNRIKNMLHQYFSEQ